MPTVADVQVVMENGARFVRQIAAETTEAHTAAVQALQQHAETRTSALEGRHVRVSDVISTTTDKHFTRQAYEPTITNICGSVQHWPGTSGVNPGIASLFTPVTHIYGQFNGLHHIDCNIVTSGKHGKTLFRGGRDSERIAKVLDMVLLPRAVEACYVHMIVCSGNLGHAVRVSKPAGQFLDRLFETDRRWTAQANYDNEDLCAVKCLRITSLEDSFVRSILPPGLCCCRLLLLHIGARGFVNMFLTLCDNVAFYPGIERDFLPLFTFFFEFVKGAC